MITRDQALTADTFHHGECRTDVGPRGGVKFTVERWRRNGSTKTWKTRPDDFQVPIKYGLRGYAYITEGSASAFHVASDCPIDELRGY